MKTHNATYHNKPEQQITDNTPSCHSYDTWPGNELDLLFTYYSIARMGPI